MVGLARAYNTRMSIWILSVQFSHVPFSPFFAMNIVQLDSEFFLKKKFFWWTKIVSSADWTGERASSRRELMLHEWSVFLLRTERYLFVVTCATGHYLHQPWGRRMGTQMRCRRGPSFLCSWTVIAYFKTVIHHQPTPPNAAAANFLQEWKLHACTLNKFLSCFFFANISY